uniref:serine/threonine-protein kinase n=1 Tax=Oculatella sp. LEGE 06141 TaxID=1828648 RepID=UPI001D145B58|nr:serine/threonine-protein kinase [Oculatella sp. LEGE 06141]
MIISLRGRYRAVEPLGQGGFGKTYLALDQDRLDARCVIKQFSPQVQGTKSLEKAVRLFNQEAVRLHELGEHSQIPTLLAYFEHDGYLYLVQQFIEGQSLLQQMRQQGAFNERQVRDVLSDILPVLRFVHQHQVIHRDITPMNILRRNTDDRLMLIDFGVAKRLSEESVAEPGTRIGTEGYAPMEQFRGGKAYPASDIYSLGATCLHLLTQAKPDTLYDPLNGRWMWREYLLERKTVVSDQFADILNKMLKDLVNERYQSADEVMRDLNADSFSPAARGVKASAPVSTSRTAALSKSAVSNPAAQRQTPLSQNPSRPPTSTPPTSKPPTSNQPVSKPGLSRPPLMRAASSACIHTFAGHSSWVTCVAISPVAPLLVSSSLDDTIKIWNFKTGELLSTLKGHVKAVNTIAISPDGKLLISGSDDYTLKLWNLHTGALLRTLTGHSRDVNTVAITPDGKLLASGGEDRTIRLWQLNSGVPLKTLVGVAGMVKAIAISSDGKLLASGGLDNKIKLWSLQSGDRLNTWQGHLNSVNAVAIAPDNQLMATGSKDKTVKLWNLRTGELLRTLSAHSRDVNTLAITPNGKALISGSSDTTIKVWNLSSGDVIETWTDHLDSVNAIAVTPDSKMLVSGSSDQTIKLWHLPG